ncbi:MAG: hypothetical protein JXA52_04935 [Planctomycetes bacterium]|nr:hypothetical protein [Planctomycetota bacterium]
MKTKEQTIDHLLGALSIEEKAGQLMVLGLTGAYAPPELDDFIDKYNIGGLRTSPTHGRIFNRYLPPGSPGIKNVVREPMLGEKIWDRSVPPHYMPASQYAKLLNRLRKRALDRKHGIPLHCVIDCEFGGGSNYNPPGLLNLPSPMGLGHIGDPDLVYRAMKTIGTQLKRIGFDMIQSPVVDVNTNPDNPEISTRSYSADPQVVIDCARAALKGLHEAGVISCAKHFPGRGASVMDAHFGISDDELSEEEMRSIHLAPYATLCKEGVIRAIMPAHAIYGALDKSGEIATVSKKIITGILREELGFDGLITTDSMTMGGLMAKYSVGEAVVRAVDAGVDIMLLKDDNRLRYEAIDGIVEAVRKGQLTEERLNESMRRIWSTKWDYGLFKDGGVVDENGVDEFLFKPEFHKIGKEAASKALQVIRDDEKLLSLKKDQKILIVDRITVPQVHQNDWYNHPGMLWEFMAEHNKNLGYIDYNADTTDKALELVKKMAPQVDIIVAVGYYNRGLHEDTRPFLRELRNFGKPVVLVTNNPFPLIIPDEYGTVVCAYDLLHDTLKAAADFLFLAK